MNQARLNKIRIVLADDQVLARAGIRALLERHPGHEVVAECVDGTQAIADVRQLKPDVAVLDIAMPGPSGIEVAHEIHRFDPRIKILILSCIDRQDIVEQAVAAPINGYLLKDFVLAELEEAVATVLSDGYFLSPRIEEMLSHHPAHGDQPPSLTPRQTEILRLVASGRSTKEIARDLNISPKTVEFHRAALMEKIGVHDVTGLTRYAMQSGVIS